MKFINRAIFILFAMTLGACGGGGADSGQSTQQNANNSNGNTGTTGVVIQTPSNSLTYPDYNVQPLAPDFEGMEKDAQQIAADIRLGWNIGNTMEAIGGETAWGNPMVSSELIKLVKESGFDAVRIPIAWDQYANQMNAEIDSDWMERVKWVVEECLAQDLYVLINIHWDGGWLENNVELDQKDAVNAKQRAYWQQIATALRDYDQRVMFASANEPHVETAEQMDVLLSYHQTFIDAVRETGGKNAYRTLVLQGPITDIEKTRDLWTEMPIDTVSGRIMAEVHFYTPFNFALMREDQSWGSQFYYWGQDYHSTTDPEHNPDWGEEDTVDELFGLMKQQFTDVGIPVILGEFSAMRRVDLTGDNLQLHLDGRAYYHQYVVESALRNGLLPFYWDNGGIDNHSSGLFDRQNNVVFDDQVLQALKTGAKIQ